MNAVVEPAAIPWWRSSVFVGALITIGSSVLSLIFPKVIAVLGLNDPIGVATASATVFQIVSLIAGIWTAYARKQSPIQPITLTAAAAAAHPNPQIPP